MVVLAAQSSPSSFQLLWGLNCRKPSPGTLRIRFPSCHARVRLLRVVACRSGAGEGGDGQASPASSGGASDPFAGWSGEESDDASSRMGKFGGIMGVGLAGIFFAAGISFAAISLSHRAAGTKKHMEPLTVEQEMLLASGEQDENIASVENEGSSSLTEGGHNHASDPETGISDEKISHVENHDTASDSRVDSISLEDSSMIEDNGSAGIDVVDTFHKTFTPANLNGSNFLDCPSELTGSNLISTGEPAYAGDLPSNDFSIDASNNNLASSTLYASIELSDNLESGVLHAQSSSGSYSTNLDSHNEDEVILSDGSEHSKLPSDSSASKVHSSDTSFFEGSTSLHSNASPDSQFVSNGIAGVQDPELQQLLPNGVHTAPSIVHSIKATVSPETNSQSNLNLSETLEAPFETSLLGDKLDVEDFGAPALLPVSPLESESGTGIQYGSDRGESLSEMLPQKFFSPAGIPAPSLVSAASQVSPGKVLVPAVTDPVQGQALAALQVLKVVEADIQPGDICSRREYARWLVAASSILSRNTTSKVYPAMYIEDVTELAFDDVTPDDPDFPSIQGLAEAGLISSRLSRFNTNDSSLDQKNVFFSPESPLSRQDLVSWKMALEKRQLPEVDRKILYQCSGYIDIDKINPDAWPALVADLSTREHGIIPLAFGYTRLFQPDKPVTKAQVAIALATGDAAEVVGEELARIEAETMADAAVAAHTALVAEVERDLNTSFEEELTMERQKIDAVEKLAEEARMELEKLRKEREEENNALIRGRAEVESEMEVLSRLRNEVEEQLQSLISNKMEIAFERERINKLRNEAEKEKEVIVQLQYELEVERKALSMARSWAEEEAKRASEQAKALEEARERWERHGLKIVVDENLREDEIAGTTWLNAGKQSPLEETIRNGESLLAKLQAMAVNVKGKSAAVIEKIIQIVTSVVSALKQWIAAASQHASELRGHVIEKASKSREELQANASEFASSIADRSSKTIQELQDNASGLCSSIRDGAKRAVEDCREGVEKLTQRFKT